MRRVDDIITRLQELKKHLKSRRSIDTVEMAIYELEYPFNPSDGVWVIEENGTSARKFASLEELEKVDISRLAAVELLRHELASALTNAIEETKQSTPTGVTWWTYAPYEVIDRMFRATNKAYSHEMTDVAHREFAELLYGLKGFVVLSGYPSKIYDELFSNKGWVKFEKDAWTLRGTLKTECLWLSPATIKALAAIT